MCATPSRVCGMVSGFASLHKLVRQVRAKVRPRALSDTFFLGVSALPPDHEMRTDEQSLRRRTLNRGSRRILPFCFVLYIVAYLDRANVAFAKLAMVADLHFSEEVFGFGAGAFFLGYFVLEIPGAMIVERWGARLWMARILITWGLLTVLVG